MSSRLVSPYAQYSTDGINPSATPPVLFDGTNTFNNAGVFYALPVLTFGMDRYRVHWTNPATGSPVGTLEVQYSLDTTTNVNGKADATIAHWTDETFFIAGVATTSFAVNGLTDITLDQNYCNGVWVRLKYTPTSGIIAPNVRITLKGDGGR